MEYLGIWHNWYRISVLLLVAQMVKHPPAMQETQVQSLGEEDPLEEGMVTHSSILAWRIPWTEKPGRLQSMGSSRVRLDWETNTHTNRGMNPSLLRQKLRVWVPSWLGPDTASGVYAEFGSTFLTWFNVESLLFASCGNATPPLFRFFSEEIIPHI